jgi:hypothetical protein
MANATRRPSSISIEDAVYPKVKFAWQSPELCADNSIDWVKRSWLIDQCNISDFPEIEFLAELICSRLSENLAGVPHLAQIDWKYKGEALQQVIVFISLASDAADDNIKIAIPLGFPGEFADSVAGSGGLMSLEEREGIFELAAIAFSLLDQSLLRTVKFQQLNLLDQPNPAATISLLPAELIAAKAARQQLSIKAPSDDLEAA